MHALATKKQPAKSKSATPPSPSPRKALWDRPPEDDLVQGWQYGPGAVVHVTDKTGRRSPIFPELNITATAAKLGVTKSHLAKVLEGSNRPSISLALKLAEALGTSVDVVISFYKGAAETAAPTSKKKVK